MPEVTIPGGQLSSPNHGVPWPELTDLMSALRVVDDGALSGRRSLDGEADSTSFRAVFQFLEDTRTAREGRGVFGPAVLACRQRSALSSVTSLPITQLRPASTGLTLSSRSWPYRHMPASRRKLSRAPRPMAIVAGLAMICSVTETASLGGMEICRRLDPVTTEDWYAPRSRPRRCTRPGRYGT